MPQLQDDLVQELVFQKDAAQSFHNFQENVKDFLDIRLSEKETGYGRPTE
jgi:hypothetical protein